MTCFGGNNTVTPINVPPAGSDDTAHASLLLHEPAGGGDMDLCAGRLRARVNHHLRGGPFLALRVAEPTPLRDGE